MPAKTAYARRPLGTLANLGTRLAGRFALPVLLAFAAGMPPILLLFFVTRRAPVPTATGIAFLVGDAVLLHQQEPSTPR
jgi:hypothetical protein